MLLKKSALVFEPLSLSIRNSIASTTPMGMRMRRSTHIFDSVALSTSSSSLRVPDFVMSIEGKVRLSESLRSRMISELPVPLNSSKITSSMRLPVSTSAVAMMVSEPPSSMLRAAPKKRFGRCRALLSTPPDSTLPEGHDGVVSPGKARDRVEQDDHILLVLDEALGFFDHHLGDLHVTLRGLVERRGDDLAPHGPLHVGDFFRPLVDE